MSAQTAGQVAGLSFTQTVDKRLVHKHALDEVFITDWDRREGRTLLAAALPRAHSLYCEYPAQDRLPDIALITEVCRQSCFVVAHTNFDVSFTDNRFQFLLQELETTLFDLEDLAPERPLEILVECKIEETRRRGQELSALTWRFSVTDQSGKVHIADSRMRMVWIDRGDWRRMRVSMRRGRQLPEVMPEQCLPDSGVPAIEVGRQNQDNVALQRVERDGDAFQAVVRPDLRHPVFFDHPIDHVYAMVQLEACRQLSIVARASRTAQDPSEIEVTHVYAYFDSVGELDTPLLMSHRRLIGAASVDPAEHNIILSQDGRQVSRFELRTGPRRYYARPYALSR